MVEWLIIAFLIAGIGWFFGGQQGAKACCANAGNLIVVGIGLWILILFISCNSHH